MKKNHPTFLMCLAVGDKFHGDQPTGRKGIPEKMPVIQVWEFSKFGQLKIECKSFPPQVLQQTLIFDNKNQTIFVTKLIRGFGHNLKGLRCDTPYILNRNTSGQRVRYSQVRVQR